MDIADSLIEANQVLNKLGLYLLNWIRLSDAMSYLNYFIRLYFSNKYVDQRIIAQINLIEALHKLIFGTKKDPEENKKLIDDICMEIESEEHNKIITNSLKSKNGFGLNRKIKEIAEEAGHPFQDEKTVKLINSIRQRFSHGATGSDISIKQYIAINKALSQIINSILLKELEKTLSETG